MVARPASAPYDPKRFDWPLAFPAEKFLASASANFLERNSFARKLSDRMRDETGTDFFEWVDHLVLSPDDEAALRAVWFRHRRHVEAAARRNGVASSARHAAARDFARRAKNKIPPSSRCVRNLSRISWRGTICPAKSKASRFRDFAVSLVNEENGTRAGGGGTPRLPRFSHRAAQAAANWRPSSRRRKCGKRAGGFLRMTPRVLRWRNSC